MRARFSDHAGTGRALAFPSSANVAFRDQDSVGSRIDILRGSMAGPHLPLPTLHVVPHGTPRTARGQCGSLYLALCKTCTHYSLPVSRRTLIYARPITSNAAGLEDFLRPRRAVSNSRKSHKLSAKKPRCIKIPVRNQSLTTSELEEVRLEL